MKRDHRSSKQDGQAMVETAIVMPTMIFMILGIIQLTMMQHARLMTELAAFNAARAGAVWNANPKIMQDAAVLTVVPTFGLASSNQAKLGFGSTGGKDFSTFAMTYFWMLLYEDGLNFWTLGQKPVQVTTINPVQEDFGGQEELDFDDAGSRGKSQLTVRVTYLYPLRIPYADYGIFHAYMAMLAGLELNRRIDGWYLNGFQTSTTMTTFMELGNIKAPNCKYNGMTTDDYKKLILSSWIFKQYFIPISANYTIRMQSNPLKKNVLKKSDVNKGC